MILTLDRCLVTYLHILCDHPSKSHLDVAMVGGLDGRQVVVGKHYDHGVLGFYIPAGATVPDKLLDEMWLKGKLAGSQKNVVKSREMDGVPTEGLFYGSRYYIMKDGEKVYVDSPSWNPSWKEGDDVTDEVGVKLS